MAYYCHWDCETLLNLEHADRQRWCQEIGKINQRISGETEKSLLDIG